MSGFANTIDFVLLGSGNVPLFFGNQTMKHVVFPYSLQANLLVNSNG